MSCFQQTNYNGECDPEIAQVNTSCQAIFGDNPLPVAPTPVNNPVNPNPVNPNPAPAPTGNLGQACQAFCNQAATCGAPCEANSCQDISLLSSLGAQCEAAAIAVFNCGASISCNSTNPSPCETEITTMNIACGNSGVGVSAMITRPSFE